jgi:DNA-binding IclR family transcriptional regulator
MAMLGAFDRDHRSMGVSDIARRSRLPKSTAFRLLAILSSWGLIERCGTKYEVGRRVTELASLANDSHRQRIRDVALPYLQDLYEITHETVHLAVLEGTDIVYVEKLYGHNRVKSPSYVGGRLNAGCTALGKALMAFSGEDTVKEVVGQLRPRTRHTIVRPKVWVDELKTIRESRVAYDREEAQLGLTCVAAPIVGWSDHAIAAVSVSGPTARFQPSGKASAVRRAAAAIARALDHEMRPLD